MLIVKHAEDDLLIREICSKYSMRADEDTGAYMVFDDYRLVGNCIYKIKDGNGMIIFADLNITDSREISDLVLRTVTDFMQRSEAKKIVSYATFPRSVYESVGYTCNSDGAVVDLAGYTLPHPCGGH